MKLEQQFSLEEFKNPPAAFRGTPFWSWNTLLNPDCLEEQIQQFSLMGMGGFHIHTRVGLDTEYLGSRYMDCVKQCVKLAKEKNLLCCLYDEDRWPSGYGGGYVTQNPEFRSKYLLITPYRKGTRAYELKAFDSRASSSPQGNGIFQAAYQVRLNPDGTLAAYCRCGEAQEEREGFTLWYVYLETAHNSPWFNNQAYVDTLNPAAIRRFLDITYEAYYREAGEEFGKTIPSIFTDEPQFLPKGCLGSAESREELQLPYTGDFSETFLETYGEDLLDHIPELLWELPEGRISLCRYWYHDHVTERFARAYGDQVGAWCEEHGIRLCGHMMEEPTLKSQTQALGEVMRSLRGFTMPGIDMLCDAREYTTAKQAQSICRQYGKPGVVSELYGVTNWDFDFRRHKLQGDWQAALGVTHRVHHLSWMSMGGEAKRDYPAAIGFQSPWYRKYPLIEDHFARVNTALRSGTPIVRIGVIHPVESYWLYYGPNQQTGQLREELDRSFQQVTGWLLFHTLDFDYISESLIPGLWDGQKTGEMDYDVIVIPGCVTLRSTTLKMLQEFWALGKKVIFMGSAPRLVDAKRNDEAARFARDCVNTGFSEGELLKELEEVRLVELRYHGEKHLKKPNHKKNWDGERTTDYLCQLRREGESQWLFIAHGGSPGNTDLVSEDQLIIRLKGSWSLEEYDTMSGTVSGLPSVREGDWTIFHHTFYEQDSLLVRMNPSDKAVENVHNKDELSAVNDPKWEINLWREPVFIVREEPNILLLDMPEFSFDGEPFGDREEILRIDNLCREKAGYPLRRAALAQPWTVKEGGRTSHKLCLRYEIVCSADLPDAGLALEEADSTAIYLDGRQINSETPDIYVDPCIRRVTLPLLDRGTHELLLEIAYTEKTNVEACYLTGNFAVEMKGTSCVLKEQPSSGSWISLTEQGMPFYGGNAAYQTQLWLEKGSYEAVISKFCAPLIEVRIDGKRVGEIWHSPYSLAFDILESGDHTLEFISFGSRVNTFGAVHNCDEREIYFDPNAWRTTGESWSYEYQLKKTGILKAPMLHKLR